MVESSPFLFEVAEGFPESLKNQEAGYVSWFTAGMEDNPTLPQDYIEHAKKTLKKDPDMFKIRVQGIPTELQGKRIFRDCLEPTRKRLCDPIGYYWFNERGFPIQVSESDLLRLDVYDIPRPHLRYVIGADLAEGGLSGDWTTCHVICVDNSTVVAKLKGKIEPGPFGKYLAWIGYWYNTATLNWEFNMQGAAVKDRLDQMRYRHVAIRESFSGRIDKVLNQVAFRTSGDSKHVVISDLRDSLADDVLVVKDRETYEELLNFGYLKKNAEWSRFKGMGALSGHDDLVISLAIAWYTTRFAQGPRKSKIQKTWGEELEEYTIRKLKREQHRLTGGYLR
jgi:hypothetical protein